MMEENTDTVGVEWKSSRTFTSTWCTNLVDNLEKSFNSINTSINNLKGEFISMKETVANKIEEIAVIANTALEKADNNEKAIKELRAEVTGLRKTCKGLSTENATLKEHTLSMEAYSRKDNIIIYGVNESEGESSIDCAKSVRFFFKNLLELSDEQINAIGFVRCHRLRESKNNNTRPIIVRFYRYSDRELIWSKVTHLKGKFPYSMSEDFPSEVAFRRNKLYPIFKKARKMPNLEKQVSLKGDKLIIVGKQYTVDTIHTLTGQLSPRSLSERTNESIYAFGGIFSDANPMTNWYKCSFKYKNREFTSSESAYLYEQALSARDVTSAELIYEAPDAYSANRLGRRIKGLNFETWKTKRDTIMTEVLTAKFTQNPDLANELKATGNKILAEAGRHPYYATGVSITDKDVLNETKWNPAGNKLGKLLQVIRDTVL